MPACLQGTEPTPVGWYLPSTGQSLFLSQVQFPSGGSKGGRRKKRRINPNTHIRETIGPCQASSLRETDKTPTSHVCMQLLLGCVPPVLSELLALWAPCRAGHMALASHAQAKISPPGCIGQGWFLQTLPVALWMKCYEDRGCIHSPPVPKPWANTHLCVQEDGCMYK